MLEFVFALIFLVLLGPLFYCLSCVIWPWGGLNSRSHAAWGFLGSFAAQVALASALPEVPGRSAAVEPAFDFSYLERCLQPVMTGYYGRLIACQSDEAAGWAAALNVVAQSDAGDRAVQLAPRLGPLGQLVYRAALEVYAQPIGVSSPFLQWEICRAGYDDGSEPDFWACVERSNAAWAGAVMDASSPLTLAEAESAARAEQVSFSDVNWRVYRAAFAARRNNETEKERQIREAKLLTLERERSRERTCQRDKSGAFVSVRSVVVRKLRAPMTAEFPWSWAEQMTYAGDCQYVVKSFVDAENGRGQKVRTNFTAAVSLADSDEWRVRKFRWD